MPEQSMQQGAGKAQAKEFYDGIWSSLTKTNVFEPKRVKEDLMTWRRGSAQLVLKINSSLDNLSIYSVLASEVPPSNSLFRYLLGYNVRQRRESLGLMESGNKTYIVLKYTMELELISEEVLQRHIYALQEVADRLDTELVEKFGGNLKFEDWNKMDQSSVDNLLDDLFN